MRYDQRALESVKNWGVDPTYFHVSKVAQMVPNMDPLSRTAIPLIPYLEKRGETYRKNGQRRVWSPTRIGQLEYTTP
jgi:hypothetical protein